MNTNTFMDQESPASMGSEGAVGLDLKAKLFGEPEAPMVVDFIGEMRSLINNDSCI